MEGVCRAPRHTEQPVQADSRCLAIGDVSELRLRWFWRGSRGWKAAALSPRAEIDFLSAHSTAQMSSFDNCCVIECAEY